MLISIHALLAESDCNEIAGRNPPIHFYPRSPCGERLAEVDGEDTSSGDFYPRSPCGERPTITGIIYSDRKISIHALLAESDDLHRGEMVLTARISIHALLAESDRATSFAVSVAENFYPRSPCGERPEADGIVDVIGEFLSTLSLRRATISDAPSSAPYAISIHALLAESDYTHPVTVLVRVIFLSTLSLRRATL